MNVKQKVLEIFQDYIGQVGGKVSPETRIVDLIGCQKADYLWAEIFLLSGGIYLEEGALQKCQTVQDVIDRAEGL